jgi:hypothetical protein
MALQDLCQARGLPLVCVQPLVSHVAREQEDLTGDKTDEGDSGLIARLARGGVRAGGLGPPAVTTGPGTHRQTAEHLGAVRCHRCRRHYA